MKRIPNQFKLALSLLLCAVIVIILVFLNKSGKIDIDTVVANIGTLNMDKTKVVDLGQDVKMEFVLIKPGSFQMGAPEEIGENDESPVHKVKLTKPFYLAKYEVTQEQWEAVMGSNPSKFKGAKLPVDTVSWDDCQKFITRLQEKTEMKFALPTEAQWEYACRAGTDSRWSFGDKEDIAGDYAWIATNSNNITHPVGEKKPNPWGLYDMHGNIQEWCADWYENPYSKDTQTDPVGPKTGDARVIRGGAWGDYPKEVRSSYRNCSGPDTKHEGIGFRVEMLAE